MNKKAANIVLKIIKKFFNKQKYNIEIPQNILSSLMHHIKITSMGGISYLVLKNNSNIPKNFLTDLKNQHSIIKKQDRLLQEAFQAIKKTDFKKTLIKENIYKYNPKYNYIPGTRYSCDIDFFINYNNIFNLHQELNKYNFYLESFSDIKLSKKMIKAAYKANKDITYLPIIIEHHKGIVQQAKYKESDYNPKYIFTKFQNNTNKYIKKLKKVTSLYQNIENSASYINQRLSKILNNNKLKQNKNDLLNQKKDLLKESNFLDSISKKRLKYIKKSILEIENILSWLKQNINLISHENEIDSYLSLLINLTNNRFNQIIQINEEIPKMRAIPVIYKNGTYIELQFKIFKKVAPFNINLNEFKTEQIFNNINALTIEDSIVLDACHYVANFGLYVHEFSEYSFHGFLKYLTDILYKIFLRKINWDRIIKLAHKTNSSSQVWIYFKHAKKHLNANIPNQVLEKLKANGSRIQNILLNFIPSKKLLFNKATLPLKLYNNFYLKDGLIKHTIAKIHKLYNYFNNEK